MKMRTVTEASGTLAELLKLAETGSVIDYYEGRFNSWNIDPNGNLFICRKSGYMWPNNIFFHICDADHKHEIYTYERKGKINWGAGQACIYINTGSHLILVKNDRTETEVYEGSWSCWAIGSKGLYFSTRDSQRIFLVNKEAEQIMQYEGRFDDWRIGANGLYIRRRNSYFFVNNKLEEIWMLTKPERQDDWAVGVNNLYFRKEDKFLLTDIHGEEITQIHEGVCESYMAGRHGLYIANKNKISLVVVK